MSFVLASRHRQKNRDTTNQADLQLENDAQEQEIQRRVQSQLAQLQQTTMDAARAAAEEAARMALLKLEEQLQQALSALQAANAQLAAPFAQKEQDIAELVLDMAFQVARHLTGEHNTQDQSSLLALITKLLIEASAERTTRQSMIVRLHPSDLSTLKDKLPQADIDLVADTSLSPGDAFVELALKDGDPLDKTEWDARLGSRLEALRNAVFPASGSEE